MIGEKQGGIRGGSTRPGKEGGGEWGWVKKNGRLHVGICGENGDSGSNLNFAGVL